jgi:catechol 2,3-dioxygenase-like lactoylglutathione lyase family enzyme
MKFDPFLLRGQGLHGIRCRYAMTVLVRTVAIRVAAFTVISGMAVCVSAAQTTASPPPGVSAGGLVSACHISPIVADLDKSARFYHDLLGLDLVPTPASGPLPWDTDPGHLNLHGLPQARLRFIGARMPGVRCGIELVEFADVARKPVRRRYQDPGAATIILTVRDIDKAFAVLKKADVPVVTTGGAPINMSTANKTRAVTVQDPDGHFVELVQLDPSPATSVAAASNVIGIRLRLTVADAERAAAYYRQVLGVFDSGDPIRPSVRNPRVMALVGLSGVSDPSGVRDAGEYRLAPTPMPASALIFELIEFKGLESAKMPTPSRVQDPGSFRLQLTFRDIDAALAGLKNAGSHVISTGGVPVGMTFGNRPWRLSVVPDPNNLFLIVQQGPLASAP